MNNKIIFKNRELAILAKEHYNLYDLNKIAAFFELNGTFSIPIKSNGLYSATSGGVQSVSGYSYTWLRDTVMITNYHVEMKHYGLARQTMQTVMNYFCNHEVRFTNVIDGKVDINDPMQRPHVRFNGDTLEEIDQQWAHAQNDALGYALWMTFRLCNLREYQLSPTERQICSLFPHYFNAIQYWHDSDSGHWEEARKIESSSIGVVIAALEEMKIFIQSNPSVRFSHSNIKITLQLLTDLIERGKEILNRFMPYESPPGRLSDGALLFLVYPLNVVTEIQAQKILVSVLNSLIGAHGIKRYIGDSYWCAEYKKLLAENERTVDFSNNIGSRDSMLKPGQEAQWCIFDPIVSVIYGIKYQNKRDVEDLKQQITYFNRCLSQITSAGECPELYYIEDASTGEYVPNDHVPLAWSQANVGIAFEYMRRSLTNT